ncbi:hypothetical protein [Aneurinibacillus terranovensis]|uniref:hypothetical protein n=1 Tax=Aneurinibacillus terranovensis TaxID=278991 RepID=UPI0004127CA3|nr:hypothetical protein [Aneurinibacillus terranovensis]
MILRNERGAALITVFIILILFMVLGLSIMGFTNQSTNVRVFENDQVQGKMLADMGLEYFKKYLEKNLVFSDLQSAIESTDDSALLAKLNPIAAKMADTGHPTYRQTVLPDNKGAFAIGYISHPFYSYKDGSNGPSQPYIHRLDVSIIGIPPRAIGNSSLTQKQVELDATVYINTIPAPFHYALSTPGELRLFGGSNIIGNVIASNVVTTTQYRYRTIPSDSTSTAQWKTGPDSSDSGAIAAINKPYIEGNVFLTSGNLYQLTAWPTDPTTGQVAAPTADTISLNSSYVSSLGTSRSELDTNKVFTPKELQGTDQQTETNLSYPAGEPYYPGYEPPIVQKQTNAVESLFQSQTIGAFIEQKMADAGSETPGFTVGSGDPATDTGPQSMQFEYPDPYTSPGEETDREFITPTTIPPGKLVIRSTYTQNIDSAPVTVRLTGDHFSGLNELYIGPSVSANPDTKAYVEMGKLSSFLNFLPPGNTDDPFTFNGTIYIKGNLDIVGDIKVNGTIYVDGDVLIREISNLANKNLVIIASGKISLTDRYADKTFSEWSSLSPSPVLFAFLYSDQGIEVYSIQSRNWINGGIASSSYIELNTRRELGTDTQKGNPSRMTVQFNRKIFDESTPGLPAGDEFFFDTYDVKYKTPPANLTIVP